MATLFTRIHGWHVLLLLFVVSLPVVTPRLYASDEIEYFAYLRSLWFDHDLSFDNEYRYFYDRDIARAWGFRETFLERTTDTGLRINFGTIGCALLWAPFYAVGDLVARAMNAAGRVVPVDGFSRPYLAAVTYGSAVYGFLAVLLSVAIARRVVGRGYVAGLAVWAGTPLVFYMYVTPGMSHACSAFATAVFVLTWLIVRDRWSTRGLIALGASAALMGMVREQDLFFALGPALDCGWTLMQRVRGTGVNQASWQKLSTNAIAGVVAFCACYLPQLVSYVILYGRPAPSPLVERKMNWLAPHAWQVLASPEHGFLLWTPMAGLALAGLVVLARQAGDGGREVATRRIALILLVMVASQVYISGSVESWSAAGTFGQRRFVALTVPLTVGLAVLFQAAHGSKMRSILTATVLLCIWWNVGLMAQFGSGMMDRQRLELSKNTYNTFVVVPLSLPNLVYRYLFQRQSFYESAAE